MNTTLRQRLIDAYIANPDGRTKAHKAAVRNAYESTIHELTTQLGQCTETIQRKTREINRLRMKVSDDDLSELTEDTTCLICADEMDGKVTLKCGHIMCPGCFARHSRVNNTCPFCRDEFAPKVKLPAKLPLESVDAMADNWSNYTRNIGYFADHLSRNRERFNENPAAAEGHIEWLVRENGKILMRKVKAWYDSEND